MLAFTVYKETVPSPLFGIYAKRDGGSVTVSVVVPFTAPEVAMIVVLPAATPVASPVMLIVATVVAEEFDVTVLVRF